MRPANPSPIATSVAATPSIQSAAREVPPLPAKPAFPVAGGRGAGGGAITDVGVDGADAVPVAVEVGVATPVGVDVVDGVAVDVAVPVGVDVVDAVAVDVAVPVGVDVADVVGVAVADAVVVGVAVPGAATSFVTDAEHLTSAPPPLPEPLHWSTFTGSVAVTVDPPVTEQV